MSGRWIAVMATAGLVLAGVLVGRVGATQTAVPAGNLVQNPGAQGIAGRTSDGDGIPAGWQTAGINESGEPDVRGIVVRRYATDSYLSKEQAAAIGGGTTHFEGGNVAVATATQTISITGAAPEIDAGGVTACLSGYLGGVGPIADVAWVDLLFLGADEARLGQLRIGPVTPGQRKGENVLLRREAQRGVPANTRQLRVVLTAEHFAGASKSASARRGGPNQAYADNISVALVKGGACAPVLTVKCVSKALVATVTPSTAAPTRRVRFAVKGGKTKQAQDGRVPFTGRFTMDGLTGTLTVTATVSQKGGGNIILTKKSRRC